MLVVREVEIDGPRKSLLKGSKQRTAPLLTSQPAAAQSSRSSEWSFSSVSQQTPFSRAIHTRHGAVGPRCSIKGFAALLIADLGQAVTWAPTHNVRAEDPDTDCAAFGSFYARHVEALAGSVNDAPDPDKVARACYGAAVLYAIFVGFCGLQVSLTSFLLSASWWLYGRQQRDPVAIGGCASHADGTDGGAPAFPAGCSVILDSADVPSTRPM